MKDDELTADTLEFPRPVDGFAVPSNAEEVQNTDMPCGECGAPTYQDLQGRVWCTRSPRCGPSRRSALVRWY